MLQDGMGITIPTTQPFNLSEVLSVTANLEGLVEPFFLEEIEDVVKHLKTNRAPGPDGFNGVFVKKCWHIIKEDFILLCNDFHAGQVSL